MSERTRPLGPPGEPRNAARVAPEVRRGRNRLAATIVVGHAIKHVYNGGMGALIMPQIKLGLRLNRAQFGALATSHSVSNGLTTLVAGFLGDRYANKAPLMLGASLGLMGGSLFLASYAPSYWYMFAAMLLVGVGPALFHPPAIRELSSRFPDRRGFAISLHGVGANVGEVLGPITVAGLLTFLMWQEVLKTSFFPAVLAGFLMWAILRTPSPVARAGVSSLREYVGSVATLLHNRAVLILVLATALRGFGEGAVGAYVPLYLVDDLEMDPLRVALFLSGAQVAGIVSQPILGYLSDKFGRKVVLVPSTASLALLSFALAVADPGVQLAVVIVGKGALTFSLHHIFIAAAIDAARGHVQSTVVALIYGATFMGSVSPFVAGLIADRYGIHSAFIYGGSILLLPTLLLLTVNLPSSTPQMEGEPSS